MICFHLVERTDFATGINDSKPIPTPSRFHLLFFLIIIETYKFCFLFKDLFSFIINASEYVFSFGYYHQMIKMTKKATNFAWIFEHFFISFNQEIVYNELIWIENRNKIFSSDQKSSLKRIFPKCNQCDWFPSLNGCSCHWDCCKFKKYFQIITIQLTGK